MAALSRLARRMRRRAAASELADRVAAIPMWWHSNWWVPNERALVALCRAAGFGDVRVLTRVPRAGSYRLVAHAYKGGL